MFEYLVLALALFIVISAVVLGFLLFPWLFLLLFLLVPLAALLLRNNVSLQRARDEPMSTSIAASWAILGLVGLSVLFIGFPAIVLGIWLHPFFFLILLLPSLLLAIPFVAIDHRSGYDTLVGQLSRGKQRMGATGGNA